MRISIGKILAGPAVLGRTLSERITPDEAKQALIRGMLGLILGVLVVASPAREAWQEREILQRAYEERTAVLDDWLAGGPTTLADLVAVHERHGLVEEARAIRAKSSGRRGLFLPWRNSRAEIAEIVRETRPSIWDQVWLGIGAILGFGYFLFFGGRPPKKPAS